MCLDKLPCAHDHKAYCFRPQPPSDAARSPQPAARPMAAAPASPAPHAFPAPSSSGSFVVVAHRGNSALRPENTFDAFDLALQQGFPHFETDVQLTSDAVPILLHDEALGRTCPGAGRVADTAWAELADRDAGSWFAAAAANSSGAGGGGSALEPADDAAWAGCRVPTLQAALQRYGGRAHIHLVRPL